MVTPEFSDWPVPDSKLLAELVHKLRGRSKAIKHLVQAFGIELAVDADHANAIECLTIKLTSWGDRANRLTLVFWADGKMWLDARRGGKNGWDYEISFYGEFCEVCPQRLHECVEASIAITDQAEMTTIWSAVNPNLVDAR